MRAILAPLLCALLAACGGGSERAAAPSRAVSPMATLVRFDDSDPHDWTGGHPWLYPVHGVDVSRYQGDVNWPLVRRSGISFAYIKATEGGDYADDRFLDNWRGARAAGLPRGAYHYYYFCRPALEQAAWFMNHVPRDGSALPPVLDLEWNHRSRTCPYRPDPSTVRKEARAFLRALEIYYGKEPLIYTTVDFYNDNDLAKLDGYRFWLRSVAGHPQDIYPGQRWAIWQYTGTGLVSGIDGLTDINAFSGSAAQLAAWTLAAAP